MKTVEDVVKLFAAEIWCDGYVPVQVEFATAVVYYVARKLDHYFPFAIALICSLTIVRDYPVSDVAAVTAIMCEENPGDMNMSTWQKRKNGLGNDGKRQIYCFPYIKVKFLKHGTF